MRLLPLLPGGVLHALTRACDLAPVLTAHMRLALWCEVYRRDTIAVLRTLRDRHGWPSRAGI